MAQDDNYEYEGWVTLYKKSKATIVFSITTHMRKEKRHSNHIEQVGSKQLRKQEGKRRMQNRKVLICVNIEVVYFCLKARNEAPA